MKLLCVNADVIRINNLKCHGDGLVEGEIYTTRGKWFVDEHGNGNYYIDGLGAKLSVRFTELLEDVSVESIERQIKEALAD